MRARVESARPPVAIGLPILSMVAREGLRALAAFGLYLALYPAWNFIGAHLVYQGVVLKLGTAFVLATQHLPVVSTLEKLSIVHLDNLTVLVLAYVLVSTRMPWAARLKRYGLVLIVVLVLHVAGVILETTIDAAQHLLDREGLVLLLPWEFRVVDGFRYLLVDFGLNIGPFVLMLIGAVWNTGLSVSWEAARRVSRRQWAQAAVSLALLGAVGVVAWRSLRESDSRHVSTHAKIGHLFVKSHQLEKAEAQYRIALEHGSIDGEAYFHLARILADEGRLGEALRVQQRGIEVVQDPAWRARLQKDWEALVSRR